MSTTHRDSYSGEADAEHMRFCENDPSGPVCKVVVRLDKMESRITAIEDGRAREKGGAEAMAKSNVRTIQLLGLVTGAITVVNFIISHWPHK